MQGSTAQCVENSIEQQSKVQYSSVQNCTKEENALQCSAFITLTWLILQNSADEEEVLVSTVQTVVHKQRLGCFGS